jgi:membrane-bound serine protease (ClpP class)
MTAAAIIATLIVVGLVLIVVEIMVPTFGIVSALAAAAFIGAIIYGYTVSTGLGHILLVALVVTVPIYCVLLVKHLPNTRLGTYVYLRKADPAEGGGNPQREQHEKLVGQLGKAESPLRPSGVVRIEGKRYQAMAEGGHVASGQAVRVIRFDGMDIIVRAASGRQA